MSEQSLPYILAHVFADTFAWYLVSDGVLIGCGEARTADGLRGVQVRAGILRVVLVGSKTNALPDHGGEWVAGTVAHDGELQRRMQEASEKFA